MIGALVMAVLVGVPVVQPNFVVKQKTKQTQEQRVEEYRKGALVQFEEIRKTIAEATNVEVTVKRTYYMATKASATTDIAISVMEIKGAGEIAVMLIRTGSEWGAYEDLFR